MPFLRLTTLLWSSTHHGCALRSPRQIFFAAPEAAVKEVHYVYAAMNGVIGIAAALAM